MEWRARELFEWLARGELTIDVSRRYRLSEARQAHEDLAARRTSGKLLLIP
ncbi:zinc-binding dehydrogenase [Nonomuraea sp. NPDC050310]|uniref:zinc-binding dehydrogenase n=1 Tax=Nonomuraea sp. NPDC050310 TaxID=3154935 RepID=UPI0033C9109C